MYTDQGMRNWTFKKLILLQTNVFQKIISFLNNLMGEQQLFNP